MYEVYWIKRTKNQIIGNFLWKYWNDIFGFPVEVHFTYPQDGKIHYSYKSEDKKIYVTAYSNKVKIKENGSVTSIEQKTLLNHLLPGPELQRPLEDYTKPNTWFSFPTSGVPIPISTNAVNQKIYKAFQGKPSQDDLIIDTDQLNPGTLSVSAYISSSDYQKLNPVQNNWWRKQDETQLPVIGFNVIYSHNLN